MTKSKPLAAAVALAFATSVLTQVASAPPPPPPTLAQVGLMIYPSKGQTPDQQKADEAECTKWAESQMG